jgi:hypothetical protein
MERQVPYELQQCWDEGTKHPDALTALRATKEFWPRWAQWQATLAREAIAGGATWDQVGKAMGTSRQGAWGKFKSVVEGGRQVDAQKESERKVREAIKEMRMRGREHDRVLAADRRRLSDDLRALDNRRKQERRDLQRQIDELRARLGSPRERQG